MPSFHTRVARLLARTLAPLLGAAAALGCGADAAVPPPPGTTHLFHIVAGGELADSVDATVAQALVVELPTPQPGVVITFAPAQTDRSRLTERGMLICPLQSGSCQTNPLYVTTDSNGRASVRLQFGTIAGSAWIYVYADALHLADSVHYAVHPGGAAGIGFDVRDSSAYVGAGYAVGAHLIDRHGNTAVGTSTARAFGTAATVTPAGVFTARQIGRSGAVFQSGILSDTAWITVPPVGTIAAYDVGVTRQAGVVTFNLDGSQLHYRASAGTPAHGQLVDWLPDGEIAYVGPDDHIAAVNAAGTVRRVTTPMLPDNTEAMPSAGSDGSIVYTTWPPGDTPAMVDRVVATGQPQTRLPLAGSGADSMPALSPDTRQIAYVSDHLYVADAMTGGVIAMAATTGAMPRWSPNGSQLVYNADTTLYLVGAGGAGRRSIGPQHYYYPRADWSPDGEWLIARTRNRLELIDVATGEALPLPPWSLPFLSPAWQH